MNEDNSSTEKEAGTPLLRRPAYSSPRTSNDQGTADGRCVMGDGRSKTDDGRPATSASAPSSTRYFHTATDSATKASEPPTSPTTGLPAPTQSGLEADGRERREERGQVHHFSMCAGTNAYAAEKQTCKSTNGQQREWQDAAPVTQPIQDVTRRPQLPHADDTIAPVNACWMCDETGHGWKLCPQRRPIARDDTPPKRPMGALPATAQHTAAGQMPMPHGQHSTAGQTGDAVVASGQVISDNTDGHASQCWMCGKTGHGWKLCPQRRRIARGEHKPNDEHSPGRPNVHVRLCPGRRTLEGRPSGHVEHRTLDCRPNRRPRPHRFSSRRHGRPRRYAGRQKHSADQTSDDEKSGDTVVVP